MVYHAAGPRRVVILHLAVHILHQRVQHGQYPAVNLRALLRLDFLFGEVKAVHIGIEAEERVRII